MTAKEKAEELFDEMSYNSSDEDHNCSHYVAKNCSLIAINELIKETGKKWWYEVKHELEKL